MKCEVCGCDHDGSYGSGRFCSDHCRRSYCGKKGGGSKPGRKLKPNSKWTCRSYYGRWTCIICNLVFHTRRDLFAHNKLLHSNVDSNGNMVVWNKWKSKSTDARIAKCSETLKRRISSGEIIPHNRGIKMPESVKRKLAIVTGGYRRGSGYGKSGWYRGIWCDSSWELAFVLYCIDFGISIERSKKTFKYEFNGKQHSYHPDFWCPSIGLIEIKGYSSKQWEAKRKSVPESERLVVIGKCEIKKYLAYAVSRYGSDFTSLYENQS